LAGAEMKAVAFSLTAVVLIALGGLVWLGYSTSYHTQIGQEHTGIENINIALEVGILKFGGFVHEYHEEIIAVGTACIALFTIILAFATGFLYVATRELVQGAEDTARRQLRAYVFLDQMTIADPLGTPRISIRIKNFGSTPAYSVVFWCEGALREYPLTGGLVRSRAQDAPISDIGPTGALQTDILWDAPIQEPDKAALTSRTKAIYVFGRIDYRDSFGQRWFSEFRFIEGGSFDVRPSGGPMGQTPEGNRSR
jgi:hypothetical protein